MIDKLIENCKNVLLVNPNFPMHKSPKKNDYRQFPLGLLKIGGYLRTKNIDFDLVNFEKEEFDLDKKYDIIFVTSIFTYWANDVKRCVDHLKRIYPNVKIVVGGIYASLLPEHCKEFTGCDVVYEGYIPQAEKVSPCYDLVDTDTQIIFSSWGCPRNCKFCSVKTIEPKYIPKKSIKDEVVMDRVDIYDNNMLANPYIDDILDELIELKKEKKIKYLTASNGFDWRILLKKPHLAKKIKEANFKNIRIAWDNAYEDGERIEEALDLLYDAGYKPRDIMMYMIYNYIYSYEVMEKKRLKCYEWGINTYPMRFHPLTLIEDNYKPTKREQTSEEYHIHEGWTDKEVRVYKSNCNKTNQCVRFNFPYFLPRHKKSVYENPHFEDRFSFSKEEALEIFGDDVFFPDEFYEIKEKEIQTTIDEKENS